MFSQLGCMVKGKEKEKEQKKKRKRNKTGFRTATSMAGHLSFVLIFTFL
jgi:hypothetical protein